MLYPPNSLYHDVLNRELFLQLAPTNDDVWFWCMAILSETKVHVVSHNIIQPTETIGAEKTPKLEDVNDRHLCQKKIQLEKVLKYYPRIKEYLIDAWASECSN